MTIRQCACGGEMYLDFFKHPKRPIEYFMRCGECQFIGPSAATEDGAKELWAQAESVEPAK